MKALPALPSLVEQVHAAILEGITSGQLVPGDRLVQASLDAVEIAQQPIGERGEAQRRSVDRVLELGRDQHGRTRRSSRRGQRHGQVAELVGSPLRPLGKTGSEAQMIPETAPQVLLFPV